MSTETELKYLINDPDAVAKFTQLLTQQQLAFTQDSRQLCNTYFDTATSALRELDFGLRVRKADNYTEQTIKTAGTVVGGLHQRPEYNVSIDETLPKLSLFPADIRPADSDLETLQAQLVAIFTTDFHRHSWQVQIADAVIEVAYDLGTIESRDQQTVISEVELELVSGQRDAIFTLAEIMMQTFHMTPGQHSKAARGYQLWQEHSSQVDAAEMSLQVPLTPELSVEKAMVLGFEHGLSCLQQAISRSLGKTSLSHLKQVYEALLFIQQGLYLHQNLIEAGQFTLFDDLLNKNLARLSWLETAIQINDLTVKSGSYRKKLEYSKQLVATLKIERGEFPSEDAIKQDLTAVDINLLQLQLLKFILAPVVRPVEKTRSLTDHACTKLTHNLAAIRDICADKTELTTQEYLLMQHHLITSLHTGNWFGALYKQTNRVHYRRTWLDVFHGIEELATLNLLQQQLAAIEQTSDKLNRWLETKVENLLQAINQSYQAALTIEPYWC